MPRPKVRAEDRRRAVLACVPCQNSKKRCDSQTPCANCRRRDCVPQCIYDPEAARPRRLSSKTQHRARDMRSDTISTTSDHGSSLDSIVCSDVPSFTKDNDTRAQVQAPRTPESPQGPQSNQTPDTIFSSCMSNAGSQEQSLEAEKPLMGDSAALSFLDFLRHTFLYYMGPSPFTDKERARAMLESAYPQSSADIPEGSPDSHLTLEEKRDYIHRFLIATTSIIYIYSPDQMFQLLEETEENRRQHSDTPGPFPSRQKDAIIDLAIAIGGQGCKTTPKSLYHAQKHFDRGQKIAFEGMLLDPTCDLVAIFLMMSIYMLCGCKRNGAFIYLGVATRVAHAMGLHLPETYHNLAPETHRSRPSETTPRLELGVTIEHEELHNPAATLSSSSCHTDDDETKELAQVCLDAAVLLVETTRRTQSAGLLIQNMALVKAWIFSACLIMGFSLFVEASLSETSATFEIETALHSGVNIIRDLDRTSPQAHRYLDVLTELHNALQSYRERLDPPPRKSNEQFLSQIFVLNQDKSSSSASYPNMPAFASSVVPPELVSESSGELSSILQQAAETTQGMSNTWRLPDESRSFVDCFLSEQGGGTEPAPMTIEGLDVHWNGISVQGTDNFLFDTESFCDILGQF
ncbi:transcriptional regulatory [Fusarium beomiforme]|uniref:Transcriptional regulatory n=1 Tax=Fusarium beomiforme TaxID=44412 RepID=A0A9P5A859_9HYPO|nr:transcriptional regulatory [Fusarium beomiforme]